ncbi:MAG: DUF4412 domain-containing protein [Holophagales bacterium]|jgi:hypothetical protein|nr:DUF4412 domain-containing protein [Holophagales bacterium]
MKQIVQIFFCLAAVTFELVSQDLKITYNTVTKAGSTQKATEILYYSSRYQRINNEKTKIDTLIDYNSFISYRIDHKKKVISRIELEDMIKIKKQIIKASEKNVATLNEARKKIYEIDDKSAVSIKKIGSETILGRPCDKWSITLGKLTYIVSADPSIHSPVSQDVKEKASPFNGGSTIPMLGPILGESFFKFWTEISKINGQLKQELQMPMGTMNVKINKEAIKIETSPIQPSIFELPKGYKEENLGQKIIEEMK